jgi:feruloyl-CoA synthase
MRARLDLEASLFRDPRFTERRLEFESRDNGEVIVTNLASFQTEHQTMTAALERWAEIAPQRVWLAERSGGGWRTVSFGEAWERIGALAAGLASLEIPADRPLLVLARNGIDHALIAYAAMGQGIPVAAVSAQFGLPGANLARLTHACRLLKPAAIYAEDAALFGTGLSAEVVEGLPVVAGASARARDLSLEALYRHGSLAPTAAPEQPAKYMLTSGSTGLPKAVICLHSNISLNAAQFAACFNDPDPPVMVNSAPWSHSLGSTAILHYSAHQGGTLYIDAGQPTATGFGETIRNLREIAPTLQNMVPAGWMLFAEALERDRALANTFFSSVRQLQYGGAALGQATADRVQAVALATVGEQISFGCGYGATETGLACNVHWPNARMGMVGLPIPGTSVRLVPEGGKLDFRVRGPQVSPGYLGQATSAVDEEGFHRIGDGVRFVDPLRPEAGMAFDGRLSENFKLASGAFVAVGELRLGAIAAIGDAVTDAVVCGEGCQYVGLLLYPNPRCPRLEIEAAVRSGLANFNAKARGSAGRVARAILLSEPPDPSTGEITDKGYVAQSVARERRASLIEALFSDPANEPVIVVP